MVEDLLDPVWPRRDTDLVDRYRAEAIARRVRGFAQLFAVLAIAWSALDAAAFDIGTVDRLLGVRAAACAAFLVLALASRGSIAGLRQAEIRVGLLFAIPGLLFLATSQILASVASTGSAASVASLYAFVPFVLAAGIAAFPLSAAEAAALAAIALLVEGWALATSTLPPHPLLPLGAFWLLGILALIASYSAIGQLKLLEELARQAVRDPLTGCYRRESGRQFLTMQYNIAARHGTPLSVLFADLDRFKAVNDNFGHEEGDRVLAGAAAALRHMTRESDLVLRWGGEEFVVVLPHTTRAEAVALLDRLRAEGVGTQPDGRPVTLSIGIAEFPADAPRDADALVELADRRMYRAKQAGRNRYAEAESEPRPLLAIPTSISSR